MSQLNRRTFVKLAGSAAVLSLAGTPWLARAGTKARVVVVGGGYSGAIAAKYLRMADPGIDVTLVEKNSKFISCPSSNEVLAGDRTIDSLTFGYDGLKGHGVKVVHGEVEAIDAANKQVKVKGGDALKYDYAVVAPGIDFKWEAIDGYDEAAAELMPHAWKAGPQTLLLRKQLEAMPDGGVVFISAPPNPFRCPPGPYERAAQIAHYLKQHKPKSKVMVLDHKTKFSKQGLFTAGWKQAYGDMISWVSGAEDGKVMAVDAKKGLLITDFSEHKADVANIIPPQRAGAVATRSGLVDDSGWCPVDQRTFESSLHKDVFVIGDSCIAGAMPKSAYAANSQGKVCAAMIAARVNGREEPEPSYVNTCYSIVTPDYGISVAAVYQYKDGKIVAVEGASGVSPSDASPEIRKREAVYQRSWFNNITADMFT
ncbi:MAG: FCSD flavin-binding domain-containing protein [Gammaproteobacteria bacterium]|nr:FCSD flavin-binding domain-containing protein [Gammaproteobacteria bacterium]